jgi:tellurite resistance protein
LNALNLDEQQASQVSQMIREHEAKVAGLRASLAPSQTNLTRMRELRQQISQISESGDEAGQAPALAELKALRQAQEDAQAAIRQAVGVAEEDLENRITGILREDQRAALEELWQAELVPAKAERPERIEPRLLRSLVERLTGLTDEQKATINGCFKGFDEASAAAQAETREASEKKLTADVLAALTPPQAERLTMLFQRHEQRHRPTAKSTGRPGGPAPIPAP